MSKVDAVACRVCSQKYVPCVVVESWIYKHYLSNIGLKNLPRKVVICKRCDFRAKISGLVPLRPNIYMMESSTEESDSEELSPVNEVKMQTQAEIEQVDPEEPKDAEAPPESENAGGSVRDIDETEYPVSVKVISLPETLKPQAKDKYEKKMFRVRFLSLAHQLQDLQAQRESDDFKAMKFQCHQCALGYMEESGYQEHMHRHSPESGPHYCDLCKQRFMSYQAMSEHTNVNHKRIFICEICEETFRTWGQCEIHRYLCYPKTGCTQCGSLDCKHKYKALACALCFKRFVQIVSPYGSTSGMKEPFYCRECKNYYKQLKMYNMEYYDINSLVTDTSNMLTTTDSVAGTSSQFPTQVGKLPTLQTATEVEEALKTVESTSTGSGGDSFKMSRDGVYDCPHCVKTYSTRSHLRKHLRHKHKETELVE